MKNKVKIYDWTDIDKIINTYSTQLLRLAYSYTYSLEDAEDIVQDVFIKFAANSNFHSEEHIKAWLIRVTINECINLNKSAHKTKQTYLDYDILPKEEDSIDLMPYLSKLSDKYKAVLYLYYFEEYDVEYIAKLLDKRISSIYTMLDRGRKQLKILLEKEGFNNEDW